MCSLLKHQKRHFHREKATKWYGSLLVGDLALESLAFLFYAQITQLYLSMEYLVISQPTSRDDRVFGDVLINEKV